MMVRLVMLRSLINDGTSIYSANALQSLKKWSKNTFVRYLPLVGCNRIIIGSELTAFGGHRPASMQGSGNMCGSHARLHDWKGLCRKGYSQ